MKEMTMKLGEVVRRERKGQGLTQSELADFSGVGLNFVSQLERGKETVRMDKLLAVLKVLGIELLLRRGKAILDVSAELV